MPENEHARRLEKIRDDRIAERRAVAAGYAESPDPVRTAEKLVAFQLQIEALQRAIEHERGLREPEYQAFFGGGNG